MIIIFGILTTIGLLSGIGVLISFAIEAFKNNNVTLGIVCIIAFVEVFIMIGLSCYGFNKSEKEETTESHK